MKRLIALFLVTASMAALSACNTMAGAGEDVSAAAPIILSGRRIGARDIALARTLGRESLTVRCPRVHILDVGAHDGRAITTSLIADVVRGDGAETVVTVALAREAEAIGKAIGRINAERRSDLLLLVGGTGAGRTDTAVVALAARGEVLANGLALRPGRTVALGRIGKLPVVAVPGAPADAMAVWLSVVEPLR